MKKMQQHIYKTIDFPPLGKNESLPNFNAIIDKRMNMITRR